MDELKNALRMLDAIHDEISLGIVSVLDRTISLDEFNSRMADADVALDKAEGLLADNQRED